MKFSPQNDIIFDFVPKVKSIDPVTASAIAGVESAALIGAIGSVIGNIFDAVGANNQNKHNLYMMREQNAFNAAQADKQRNWLKQQTSVQNAFNSGEAATARDWQEKMIEQQNIFNSPVNQLKRMREAGINPALLEMDGSIRSASPTASPQASAASVGSPSSASAAGAIPAVNPFSNIGNSALAALQAKKLNAEIQSIEDDNQRKNDLHPYDIQTAEGNLRLIGVEAEVGEKTRDKLAAEIPVIQQTGMNLREEYNSIVLRNGLTQKELDTFDEKFDALMRKFEDEHNLSVENIAAIKQSVMESLSRARLNNANAEAVEGNNFLSSLEIRVKRKHEKAIMGMMWNQEISKYELFHEQLATDKRLAKLRNSGKFLPFDVPLVDEYAVIQLDFLRILSECIGLSAGANISNSTSTSTSNSHSTVRSTSSNVSDIFTHRVE